MTDRHAPNSVGYVVPFWWRVLLAVLLSCRLSCQQTSRFLKFLYCLLPLYVVLGVAGGVMIDMTRQNALTFDCMLALYLHDGVQILSRT